MAFVQITSDSWGKTVSHPLIFKGSLQLLKLIARGIVSIVWRSARYSAVQFSLGYRLQGLCLGENDSETDVHSPSLKGHVPRLVDVPL